MNNAAIIRKYLESRGFTTVANAFYTSMKDWESWYRGHFAKFHDYRQYNGTKFVNKRRKSLGMAKKVCEDHASILLNEKVTITVNESWQEEFNKILKRNKFAVMANRLVEITFALGTGAFVEYLDDKQQVVIDYIRADMIFPLSWVNDDITEVAFGSLIKSRGKQKLYINLHYLDEAGNYVIENRLLSEDQNKAVVVENIEGVIEELSTGSPTPRFQILKPNLINNADTQDPSNPMGIPVFANSLDVLEAVDLVFDSYVSEFRLGKKRVFVPVSMTRAITDEQGITRPIFDDNDTEFYALSDDASKEFKEVNMDIRHESHEVGLQRFLNILSDKCGLGTDRYKFDSRTGGVKTATEVVSEKSDLYQNLKKNELVLDSALVGLATCIAELLNKDNSEASVNFDDSIIEDTNTITNRAMVEYTSGLIDDVMYFMKAYKLTEEQAIELVKKIKDRAAKKGEETPPPGGDEGDGEEGDDEIPEEVEIIEDEEETKE
jgi:A118 family predicted phage portal protein